MASQRGARSVAHRTLQAGQDALPVAREGITDSNYERGLRWASFFLREALVMIDARLAELQAGQDE